MIKNALLKDTDISREEYAERVKEADRATEAHGVEGSAPIDEETREARMRMNFYGAMLNVGMSLIAALDEINENIKILNNNIVVLSGGENDAGKSASGN